MSFSDGGPLPSASPLMLGAGLFMIIAWAVTIVLAAIGSKKPRLQRILLITSSISWLLPICTLALAFIETSAPTYAFGSFASAVVALFIAYVGIETNPKPQQPQLPNTKPL